MADDRLEDELLEDRIRTNVFDPVLMRRLLRFARPYVGWIVLGTVLVCFSAFLTVLPAALVGALVDLVFTRGDGLPARAVARVLGIFLAPNGAERIIQLAPQTKLWLFATLFLILRVATFLVDWGNGYLLASLGQRILYDIRMEVFRHIHSLSLSFFHRNPVGRLVTRTVNDVGALEELFSTVLVTILKDFGMLAGIVTLLIVFQWKLALVVLSVMPLMVAAAITFRRYSRTYYRKWRAELSRLNSFMAEALSGIRVVQLFHKEERNDRSYDAIGRSYRKYFLDQRRAWSYFRPINTTLSAAGIGLVLWFGGHAVLQAAGGQRVSLAIGSVMTVGLLTSFLAYSEQFFAPIRDFTEKFDVLQGAMTSAERIFTILDTRPQFVDRPGARDPGRFRGDIAFEKVTFSYIPGEPVLEAVDFRIDAGTTVAIVGHTGAGKTTIINLISRLYEVREGAVRIDGTDIREFLQEPLRRNIAVVHQDVFLFAGTILENIRLGDERIWRERVVEACRVVGVDRFIERLPGGYDAAVEEGGKTFSAGERQLLSFARALVFDPTILVLDEATSSIDTHTEKAIEAALTKLTEGRTSIVIAHRLSTVQRADRILVMHRGRLAEEGTHRELLSRGGIYEKLYRLQYVGPEEAEEPRPDEGERDAIDADAPRTTGPADTAGTTDLTDAPTLF